MNKIDKIIESKSKEFVRKLEDGKFNIPNEHNEFYMSEFLITQWLKSTIKDIIKIKGELKL